MSTQISAAQCVAVALGSGLGALARWATSLLLAPVTAAFPLGTLAVNGLGGLLMGVAMVGLQRAPDDLLRLFVVTGFLGGFTTFSAFSAESLDLLQRGQPGWAVTHALAHVLGALACAALGYCLARWLWVR